MTYDADNRLITYNGEEILYDEEGNMVYGVVNGEMTTLTYDCRNRLVTAGEWHYTYDAENNRISSGNNEYEETYIVDTVSQSLSRVLTTTRYNKTQGSITGVTVTTYIFGNGLEYQKDNTTGKHLYYHYNNIGSTTKLTNQNGEIVEEYTYGAYGELLSGDTEATPYLYNGRYGVSTEKNGLYYMRQRYYNPDIKRFINRDVVRGTLSNSQSLNRYSYVQGNPISLTDPFGLSPLSNLPSLGTIVHTVLNVVGCVPGPIGTAADLANAAVYAFVDKDYGNALQCVMSGVMSGISDVASAISKTSKTANYIATTANIISNVTVFGMNAEMAVDMGVTMWDEYVVKDEKFSLGTLGEIAVLGFSLLGMKNSAKGALDSAKNLANMMKQDNVAGKIKESLTNFANDNRGCIGGDAYGGKSGSDTKKPYATSRPSYGKGQVEQVWENAKDPITGKVYDPSGVEITWDPTKPRNGQWDMGHIPGEKYSEMHQLYMDDVIMMLYHKS